MKYILTLILAMAFFRMDAQNLQFSQVLTYSGNQVVPVGFVVPVGKVWKVESASTAFTQWSVNNVSFLESGYTSSGTYRTIPDKFPFWLKEGDVLTPGNVGTNSYSYFVSIIEFTIVP